MQRAVNSPAIGLTIETPIRHLLGDDEINDGIQTLWGDLEITGIVEKHAIDTNITLFDGHRRVDTAIFAYVMIQNDMDRLDGYGVFRRESKMF